MKPKREETVLHLRKVDQSRENECVLDKVGKFLARNWSSGNDNDEVGDSSGSDDIDDEEDQMIQRLHRGNSALR